jgi:hypothetical protein
MRSTRSTWIGLCFLAISCGSGQKSHPPIDGSLSDEPPPDGSPPGPGSVVYVADSRNDTIRKVTTQSVVTTLAGKAGTRDSADGIGTRARFDQPFGLAVDGSGNVYVADTYNNTIRKVTPGGAVTTLAGTAGPDGGSADGTGSAASFNVPVGIAVDSDGTLYVADQRNNTIRKVSAAGAVTTLAGSPPPMPPGSADGTGADARFSAPTGVAVDNSGNVYVADGSNNTIRKVTPAGVVTTLAGLAGRNGSTDATGDMARFNFPSGVAVDGMGNVYVADEINCTIRKVTPDGAVSTLAGSSGSPPSSMDGTGGTARFNAPTSVAVDNSGNVYVADHFNYTIRKVTAAGDVTTLAGTAGEHGSADGTGADARFYEPSGVAVAR